MKRRGPDSSDNNKSPLDLGLNDLIGSKAPEEGPGEKSPAASSETAFSAFAGKEDWQGLAEFSEKCISGVSAEEDAEAKLWWIKSQFHLLHVPVSILAAPLDLLSRDLQEGRLGGEGDADRRLSDLVRDLLTAFIPKLKEAGDVRTAEVFQSRFEGLFGANRESDPSPAITEENGGENEIQQNRKGLTEAERLRMDLGITSDVGAPFPVMDTQFLDGLVKKQHSFWKSYFVIGLLIAAFSVGGLWWYTRHLNRVALAAAAVPVAPEAVASRREMQLITPETVRLEDVNSLSSLLYSIDEKKTPDVPPAQPQKQAQESPPQPQLPRQKEQVNTNYPPEPGSRIDREPVRDPLWGDRKRQDRSPFGDDDIERGIPVVKFPRPEVYRVITDTLVLPQPSLRAKPIQKLRRGDEVLVEAKVGYWLRLRSQSNRPGFILAQDAEVK